MTSPGSIEAQVRKRHQFEAHLKEALSITAAMSDQELELALARLADKALAEGEESDAKLKVKVLTICAALRATGTRKQCRRARRGQNIKAGIYFGNMGELLINRIARYPLKVPFTKPESEIDEYLLEAIERLLP